MLYVAFSGFDQIAAGTLAGGLSPAGLDGALIFDLARLAGWSMSIPAFRRPKTPQSPAAQSWG